MTWTKTSDDFSDDCEELSHAAYRAHHEGLTWSNRKLLDCLLPKAKVHKYINAPEGIPELLACGFWTDEGDHYRIRHHSGYQRTKDEVIAQQERNAKNGAKGGRPRKAPREVWQPPKTQSVSESVGESKSQGDRTGQDGPGQEELPDTAGTRDEAPDWTGPPRPGVVDLSTGEVDEDDYLRSLGVCSRCGGQGCPGCVAVMERSA